jgi:2-keto-4-pentenoate hydratase
MARQRDARAAMLYEGAQPLGWKIGVTGAGGQEALGIDAPLVGFLTDATLLRDGATVSVDGWAAPVLEAEIAVRMGRDVPGDATREEAAAAVDALAPAIELADTGDRPMAVEEVLAGNVFHRAVLLGRWDETRAGLRLDGITLDVEGGSADVHGAEPHGLSGDLPELVRHVAATLAEVGETLAAGDVVITGAIVPPAPVEAGQEIAVRLSGLGGLGVRITAGA